MPHYRLRSSLIVCSLMAGVLAMSCDRPPPPQNSAQSPSQSSPPSAAQESFQSERSPDTQTPQVYWLDATADTIQLIPKPISSDSKSEEGDGGELELAFQQLLAGPKEEAYVSEIPEQTKLLEVKQLPDGIYVNLSQEFETGGGTMSMTGRLAQVLHTATSLNPDARVWLQVEGETREVFGGEGLVLEQPLSRDRFKVDFGL